MLAQTCDVSPHTLNAVDSLLYYKTMRPEYVHVLRHAS